MPPCLLGLIHRKRPNKLKARVGVRSLWKTGQMQVPGQRPSLVHLPVHCFRLSVQKMVRGELGSIGSKTGWSGGANGKQNPKPSSCSLPKSFPLSQDGGEWMLAARRGSGRPPPCPGPCLGGLARPGSPAVPVALTRICPMFWARGEWSSPAQGPHAFFLS